MGPGARLARAAPLAVLARSGEALGLRLQREALDVPASEMESIPVAHDARRERAKSRREPLEKDRVGLDHVAVGVDDSGGVHAGGAPIASW